MATNILKTRKTRIVCVSDTHNAANGSFKLPKGDVLIHAGDLTNQGTFTELQKTVKWIEEADFEAKIVVAGNHDVTLDKPFYDQYGLYFHNQEPQDGDKCRKLLEQSSSILYLKHEAAIVRLTAADGPRTTFKVFGSPYSPAKGMWGFAYNPEDATKLWDKIPLDSDIVITHTPPKYHCDERNDRRSVGCESLRCMLWRVRPRLSVCGHIHESRGAEIIKWDLGMSNIKYKEAGIQRWTDPGKDNKKTSLVDLTVKGGTPVANNGTGEDDRVDNTEKVDSLGASETGSFRKEKNKSSSVTFSRLAPSPVPSVAPTKRPTIMRGLSHVGTSLLAIPTDSSEPVTRGQGGVPPSIRCDLQALSGRLGRKETWVINAAIMASSWPYKETGGKKFNKPIVVDIDLPIWAGNE